eukprot:232487-Amphidinium_carterae.2
MHCQNATKRQHCRPDSATEFEVENETHGLCNTHKKQYLNTTTTHAKHVHFTSLLTLCSSPSFQWTCCAIIMIKWPLRNKRDKPCTTSPASTTRPCKFAE